MNNHHYVAIMAGGVGSRFWPSSREASPKQFLDILGTGKSLLRLTFERFLKLVPAERIYIVTNEQYRGLVAEHLPELSHEQILGEPSRNNTAPCIAYTAFKLADLDPEANLVVAPSDHLILQEDRFIDILQQGLDFTASHEALLTLGIQPTRPDTGYGYIRYEQGADPVKKVLQFTEKPPLAQARDYLDSGDYLWNAGIFVWKVKTLLESFRTNAPGIYTLLEGDGRYNTPAERDFLEANYPNTPSISVDYAIMEKADNVYTIPSSFGWNDLGTWASLHDVAEKDGRQNLVKAEYQVLREIDDSLIRMPEGKLIVARGLKDYIIVDEGDALLIWPKSDEQAIKQVRQEVETKFGRQFL